MSWRHPTAEDFDHEHDLRKHEPRPDDNQPKLPHPSVLAIETALSVRNQGLKLLDAARLIEAFAAAEAARVRLECVAAGANA